MANRLLVLSHGEVQLDGEPLDIFSTKQDVLHEAGVAVPPVTAVLQYLQGRGIAVTDRVHSIDEGVDALYHCLRGKNDAH